MYGLSPKQRVGLDAQVKEAARKGNVIAITPEMVEQYPRLNLLIGEAVTRGYSVVRTNNHILVYPKTFPLVPARSFRGLAASNILSLGLIIVDKGSKLVSGIKRFFP